MMDYFVRKGLLFFFLVLFLSGCKGVGTSPDQTTAEYVYRGTQGIDMVFSQNLPPSRLYDTTPLAIVTEVENKGTYDLTGGRCFLHLSGYDKSIIRGIDSEKPCGENLWPKSPGFPEGGYDVVEFETDTLRLPTGIDSFPQKFILTACYEYETVANPVVCVDPGLYKIRAIKDACVVSDVPLSGGQGAPVEVSRVEVSMGGENRAAFTIHVSNVGRGNVLRSGTGLAGSGSHSCPFNLEHDDFNIIDYQVDMTDGFMIKCSPEKLRLVNDVGKIFCTFNVPGEYARTTPLRIKLFYNYMQSISKNVDIIKTPG